MNSSDDMSRLSVKRSNLGPLYNIQIHDNIAFTEAPCAEFDPSYSVAEQLRARRPLRSRAKGAKRSSCVANSWFRCTVVDAQPSANYGVLQPETAGAETTHSPFWYSAATDDEPQPQSLPAPR
jgi:hypothetical protein